MSTSQLYVWGQSVAFAAAACFLFFSAHLIVRLTTEARVADRHDQFLELVASTRGRIESELVTTATLSQGMAAMISAMGSQPDSVMQTAVEVLYRSGRHLRNIGLAPDNIVRFVYPVQGNEAALGLRYEDQQDQWPAVRRAIESGGPVLAGPVKLLQGGRGLINRTPVFRPDGSYWGLLSVVIDFDSMLDALGVADDSIMHYALRGSDGLGTQGAMITGDPAVFGQDPILMSLQVPGGSWQLAAIPRQGWLEPAVNGWLVVGYYGTALVLTLLLWAVLRERARAQRATRALQKANRRLSAVNEELERLSETDPLTGLPNRRGLDDVLQVEWRRSRRHGEPLSLLIVDVDEFKRYNDTYGHPQGDACLQRVADTMQQMAQRSGEFLARIGGEEFVLVMPDSGMAEAELQAERLRAAIEALAIPHRLSPVLPVVTVSIGIATLSEDAPATLSELMQQADEALYQAKHLGRNRVVGRGPVEQAL